MEVLKQGIPNNNAREVREKEGFYGRKLFFEHSYKVLIVPDSDVERGAVQSKQLTQE